MKYKYNKLLPLNIRIPFRWRNNKSYFTLSQFGDVNLEIKNIVDATLITYKKNKVKIEFRLKDDIRDYRIKFTKKKIPLEYRGRVK